MSDTIIRCKRYYAYLLRSGVTCALMFFVLVAHAKELEYPCRHDIEKGKYDKALTKLSKLSEKTPNNHAIAFALYRLYIMPDFEKNDLKQAYYHLCASQDYLNAYYTKDLDKAEKDGYTPTMYAGEYANVGQHAIVKATKTNTVDEWNDFLATYKRVTQKQIGQAIQTRNALAFKQAEEANTVDAFTQFINTYPDAQERKRAEDKLHALAYSKAQAENTVQAYKKFVEMYPLAPQVGQAQRNIYELAYQAIKESGNEQDFRQYIQMYPDSPYLRKATDRADELEMRRLVERGNVNTYKGYLRTHTADNCWRDSVMLYYAENVRSTQSIEAAEWGINNLRGEYRDSCWAILRNICLEEYNLDAFKEFHREYQAKSISDIQRNDEKIADADYDYLFDNITLSQWIDIVAPAYPAYKKLVSLIEDDIKNKRWQAALTKVEEHADAFGNNHRYNDLVRVLKEKDDPKMIATSLGAGVNTTQGSEYAPALSADGKHILFCAQNRTDNIGGEDIFIADKIQGVWKNSRIVPGVNTAYGNEAPEAISADGTTMLVFHNGTQSVTHKEKHGWGVLEKLSDNINISNWQADAMISSDGKAMLFAADYRVAYEHDLSINIFVSLLQENGEWGTPIDLGPVINTSMTDRSPVLHPDMKTLYFCSEGHSSLGGMDVFMSTRLSEDSWTEWSEPINMGKVINTTESECWYKISTDGKLAYFSKNINGKYDIYQLSIPAHLRPRPVATISGKLVDTQGLPVETTIRWEDLETHTTIGQSKTDPVDGSFFIVLPEGKNYGYYIDDETFFPVSDNIDLRNTNELVSIQNDIHVATISEMIERETPMPMNNLFFNTGEYILLPASVTELNRVAEIIKRLAQKVEISGHTDDVGNDESNIILSENRANAVRDYLISIGIDNSLLSTQGYGESKPVASNKTAEGRRKNRRVELKFVK